MPLIEAPFVKPPFESTAPPLQGTGPTILPSGSYQVPSFKNDRDEFSQEKETESDRRRRLEDANIVKPPRAPVAKKQAIDSFLAALDPSLDATSPVNRITFAKASLNLGSWFAFSASKKQTYRPDFSVGLHSAFRVFPPPEQSPAKTQWSYFTGPSVVSFNGGVFAKGTDRYAQEVSVYADFASTFWGWHLAAEQSVMLLPYLRGVTDLIFVMYPIKTHRVFTNSTAIAPKKSETRTHNTLQWQGLGVEASWQAELAKMFGAGFFAQVSGAAPNVLRVQFGLKVSAVLSEEPKSTESKNESPKVP